MRKHKATHNVFRDLGFGSQEAASLKVRAMLMAESKNTFAPST